MSCNSDANKKISRFYAGAVDLNLGKIFTLYRLPGLFR